MGCCRLGVPYPGFQTSYGIAKRLLRVDSGRLSAGSQRQDLRAHLLRGGRIIG